MFKPNRQFQKGLDQGAARKTRQSNTISLRRKARDNKLTTKARKQSTRSNDDDEKMNNSSNLTISDIPQFKINLKRPSFKQSSIISLRILSGTNDESVLKIICENEIVPILISFTFGNDYKLCLEASCILLNICSDSHEETSIAVANGAIKAFIYILQGNHFNSNELVNNAIWGLANIAADCNEYKVMIGKTKIIDTIMIELLSSDFKHEDMVENCTRLIYNLMNNSTEKFMKQLFENNVSNLLSILEQISKSENEKVLKYALRCLRILTNTQNNSVIEHIVSFKNGIFIKFCINMLYGQFIKYKNALNNENGKNIREALLTLSNSIYNPTIKIIKNILNNNDEFGIKQQLINSNYLNIIEPYFHHFVKSVKIDMYYCLGTFCAGNEEQITYILNKTFLMKAMIKDAINDTLSIRIGAIICICNCIDIAVPTQIKILHKFGSINALCQLLNTRNIIDNNILLRVCEALEVFINTFDNTQFGNPIINEIDQLNGFTYLEERAMSESVPQNIAHKIFSVIEYWDKIDTIVPDMELNNNCINKFTFNCREM